MVNKNPFFFRELPLTSAFCDREKELADLESYAKGRANVVVYSPRRYGKTSLVKRVQKKLVDSGYLTIFVDFFGVTSLEEAASRMAKGIFEVTRLKENIFQKAIRSLRSFRPILKPDTEGGVSLSVEFVPSQKRGLDLLEETLISLETFLKEGIDKLHVVLDEFQEIAELKESGQIEAILRTHIQRHTFSYFFVGSRRRILLEIFNERKRPFFQSAINYEIAKLPHEDLKNFLVAMFQQGGKNCPQEAAEKISGIVFQHPYYAQKLGFFTFEASEKARIQLSDVSMAFEELLGSEKPVFEAILQGLAPKQIALLKALAREPSGSVFSLDYMTRHQLGSVGGVQGALKKLATLDVIEQDPKGDWVVVDPIFAQWMQK